MNTIKFSISSMKYSIDDKLAGRDLHGLPCRVPEPTPEQAKCSHTKYEKVYEQEDVLEDGVWWGETRTSEYAYRWVETTCMNDVPGTNNIRCERCGYTRRY